MSSQGSGEGALGFLPEPGESRTLRGETVAKKKEKVKVWMLTGCRGEKTLDEDTGRKEQLLPRTVHTVGAGFAASLIAHGRAEVYAEQDKGPKKKAPPSVGDKRKAAAGKKKAAAEKRAAAKKAEDDAGDDDGDDDGDDPK